MASATAQIPPPGSSQETADVSADQLADSDFAKATHKYQELRGTGDQDSEQSPGMPLPGAESEAAVYGPEIGGYYNPKTGEAFRVGAPGEVVSKLDESVQKRLETLEPPAADARLLSSQIKRGSEDIERKLDEGASGPSHKLQSDDGHEGQTTNDLDPVQALKLARIVPDLVDRVEWNSLLKFGVRFNDRQISNGAVLQAEDMLSTPHIQLHKDRVVTPEDVYLLLFVDLDSSSEDHVTGREYLHWLVQNVPTPSQRVAMDPVHVFGQELFPYDGRTPRQGQGQHRQVFLLYKMRHHLTSAAAPTNRDAFSSRSFALDHNLGNPVLAFYFNTS